MEKCVILSKEKLKEFLITKAVLREMLKGLLYKEEKDKKYEI